MKKISAPKKLSLSRESLKRLDGPQLAQVAGGTKLVSETDPITREPPPITEFTCTCPLRG